MPRRAFVLLEVMVAVMILGIAMVALMKGLTLSIDQMKKINEQEAGILLAKSMLNDLTLEPNKEGRYQGSFEDDPRFADYEGWTWKVRIEAHEPDYDEIPREASSGTEVEYYYLAEIEIFRNETDRNDGERLIVTLNTILLEADILDANSIVKNQLI